MQGEDIIEHTNRKCCCLLFRMQEEDVLEHINAKCHLWTCRPFCNIGMHLITHIEHTHAKILVSTLERQVS